VAVKMNSVAHGMNNFRLCPPRVETVERTRWSPRHEWEYIRVTTYY